MQVQSGRLRLPRRPEAEAMSDEHERLGRAVGDARKRLAELPPNHDEIAAHCDVDFTADDNIVLGQE